MFISPEQVAAVIEKLPNSSYKLLFSFAGYAGLRVPSETRTLNRSDIDEAVSVIHVRCAKTEGHDGRSERYVPICEPLRHLLKSRMLECEAGEALCPMGSCNEIGGYARRVIKAAVEAAGLTMWEDIFQTLRSSVAKAWKAGGIPEFAVDGWLGHNNVTSRKHYTSNVPSQMFELISGVKQAAQNPARKASEFGGSQVVSSEGQKKQLMGFA